MNFGKGLLAWRKHRNYSQEELAELADVTVDTISRYESGRSVEPTAKTKRRLAKALGIAPEDFYRPPDSIPERVQSLDDVINEIRSGYGSGIYTKEQIERELLEFMLEIKSIEQSDKNSS